MAKTIKRRRGMELKGVWTRLLATVLDGAVIWGMTGILERLTSKAVTGGITAMGVTVPAWLIVAILYFIVFEGITGTTIGKMLMGLKVVKEDGTPCGITSAFIRNLVRPFDIVTFFIWATNKQQRLGDFMAKTYVVEKSR